MPCYPTGLVDLLCVAHEQETASRMNYADVVSVVVDGANLKGRLPLAKRAPNHHRPLWVLATLAADSFAQCHQSWSKYNSLVMNLLGIPGMPKT